METASLLTITTTVVGCLIWVIRHVLTSTIPDMQDKFEKRLDTLAATFAAEKAEDRAVYKEAVDSQKAKHGEIVEVLKTISANGASQNAKLDQLITFSVNSKK